MAEHFHQSVAHRINGRAKAMIVTRSRFHAIRYHRALERDRPIQPWTCPDEFGTS